MWSRIYRRRVRVPVGIAARVQLIAVSKTKPVEMLMEAYDRQIRDFGENKPQEIREKFPQLPEDIRWHMIGHLQRNKIKYIIDKVCMIHSIESVRLAEAVNEEAAKHGRVIPVLVEVNMAGEETKSGFVRRRRKTLSGD